MHADVYDLYVYHTRFLIIITLKNYRLPTDNLSVLNSGHSSDGSCSAVIFKKWIIILGDHRKDIVRLKHWNFNEFWCFNYNKQKSSLEEEKDIDSSTLILDLI